MAPNHKIHATHALEDRFFPTTSVASVPVADSFIVVIPCWECSFSTTVGPVVEEFIRH